MLKILEDLRFSSQQKMGILAEVSRMFLPNPGIEQQECRFPDHIKEGVLTEIQDQLGLAHDDRSPAAKTKILEFLSDEMAGDALGNVNLTEVKERTAKLELQVGNYNCLPLRK